MVTDVSDGWEEAILQSVREAAQERIDLLEKEIQRIRGEEAAILGVLQGIITKAKAGDLEFLSPVPSDDRSNWSVVVEQDKEFWLPQFGTSYGVLVHWYFPSCGSPLQTMRGGPIYLEAKRQVEQSDDRES